MALESDSGVALWRDGGEARVVETPRVRVRRASRCPALLAILAVMPGGCGEEEAGEEEG